MAFVHVASSRCRYVLLKYFGGCCWAYRGISARESYLAAVHTYEMRPACDCRLSYLEATRSCPRTGGYPARASSRNSTCSLSVLQCSPEVPRGEGKNTYKTTPVPVAVIAIWKGGRICLSLRTVLAGTSSAGGMLSLICPTQDGPSTPGLPAFTHSTTACCPVLHALTARCRQVAGDSQPVLFPVLCTQGNITKGLL